MVTDVNRDEGLAIRLVLIALRQRIMKLCAEQVYEGNHRLNRSNLSSGSSFHSCFGGWGGLYLSGVPEYLGLSLTRICVI